MEDKRLELSLAPPGELSDCDTRNPSDNRSDGGGTMAFQNPWSSFASLKSTSSPVNTQPTNSRKRIESSPVVGWPPVRSFRRNLGGNLASKSPTNGSDACRDPKQSHDGAPRQAADMSKPQMFVKINMEGVPIGRKINLSSFSSYEDLSLAVDKLFTVLLAAQRGSYDGEKATAENEIKRSIGPSGEYTLVYEDNEGDRVLVGDVPWHMFVSSVKRLHVLKTCEISTLLGDGSSAQEKVATKSLLNNEK